jgi:hypothetical protein
MQAIHPHTGIKRPAGKVMAGTQRKPLGQSIWTAKAIKKVALTALRDI